MAQSMGREGPGVGERWLALGLIDEASRTLVRLQRVRGAGQRTRRRIARTAAMMLAAGLLIGATPFARPGQAAPQTFLHQFPFGLKSIGTRPDHAVVDIDGDGDLDVFVGNRTYGVTYFENTGTTAQPDFAPPRLNALGLSMMANYYGLHPAFADIDGDGDFDAFVGGSSFQSVFYFDNTGSSTSPAFALADPGRPSISQFFGIENTGNDSVPTFADIDGDGDQDLFVGNFGNLKFFENTGTSAAPALASAVDTPFGLIHFGVAPGQVTRVSSEFADLDGDDDLDAIVRWNGTAHFFYPNTGSSTAPAFAFMSTVNNAFGLVSYGVPPAFADIDGDGDIDAFAGEYYGASIFYDNTGTTAAPAFAASSANGFGLVRVGYSAQPSFVDIDGDDDLDFFIGRNTFAQIVLYPNTGSSAAPAFGASSSNPFGLIQTLLSNGPIFADIDGDGDPDAFLPRMNDVVYQENTGTSALPAFASTVVNPFGLTSPGVEPRPAFVDLDADGDLDAVLGYSPGRTAYFENTGSSTAPAFAASVRNAFGLGDDATLGVTKPAFADIDRDGDLDAFLGAQDTQFFRNTGNSSAPAFAASVPNPFGIGFFSGSVAPTFADLDGDGDLDGFIGDGRGRVHYFENYGCGNAVVEGSEECDDGNGIDADACNDLCQLPGGDADDDGVNNGTESGGPNGGDGNGDGVADSTQANVATLPAATDGSPITVVSDPACPLSDVVAEDTMPGFIMPFGMLGFTLEDCESSRVAVYYHGADDFGGLFEYLKHGANPPGAGNDVVYPLAAGAPHFVELGSAALPFDSAVAHAEFTLADDVVGDSSGDDGTIVDPGGPGFAVGDALTAPALSWAGIGAALLALLGVARRRPPR